MNYLVDTSVLARVSRSEVVAKRLASIDPGELYTCAAVLLEMGWSARSGKELRAQRELLLGMRRVDVGSAVETLALANQATLADLGQHRAAKIPDLLIAAVAQAYDLTVLHYDRDFEIIASVTFQPVEWVVPAGSVS